MAFLNTYLTLSKRLNKNSDAKISSIYDFLLDFPVSDEAYTVFCDINLLSNFSPVQKENLIKHFFNSLKNKVSYLTEQEKIALFVSHNYFMSFFKNALFCCENKQLHDLKHEIADYIIKNTIINLNINFSINNLLVLGTLQQLLEFAKFDKSPEEAKNIVLLNIIEVSKLVHDDFMNKLETFEQPLSHEHKTLLDEQIKLYKEIPALNSLVRIANSFFSIAKSSYGKEDNEFDLSMIASQILLDDSGLFRGLVNDDKSRYIDKLKQQISIYLQFIFPAYTAISQKLEFNGTLLTLQMFKSNDDKHIQRALKDFIEEDYYGFLSRSIPLIEKKLRLILRNLGEADIKENDIGGFDFRPMNAFMSSPTIADTFTSPVQLLFKIIYDDRRGFNLRNKVAHGIIEADEINLFHALMVLFTIVYLSSIEFRPIPIDKS